MLAQRVDARDARGEQVALGVDHVELARHAVLVAQSGEARGLGQGLLARRLGIEALARAVAEFGSARQGQPGSPSRP